MEFETINYKNMSDMVIDQITDKIIHGELKAGDKLPTEKELVELMGVGRSTVREALKALVTLGFIERSKAGTIVVAPKNETMGQLMQCYISLKRISIRQLFQLRLILETEFIDTVARNASAEDVEALERILSQKDDPSSDKATVNINFHACIAKLTKNQAFMLIMEMLRPVMFQSQALTLAYDNAKSGETDAEHREMLEAIKAGDSQKAVEIMKRHLHNIYKHLEA